MACVPEGGAASCAALAFLFAAFFWAFVRGLAPFSVAWEAAVGPSGTEAGAVAASGAPRRLRRDLAGNSSCKNVRLWVCALERPESVARCSEAGWFLHSFVQRQWLMADWVRDRSDLSDMAAIPSLTL